MPSLTLEGILGPDITLKISIFTKALLTRFSRSVDFSTFFCYAVCAVLCSALHQCNDFNHLLYI